MKNIKLTVVADEDGQILAAARNVPSYDDSPNLLGLRAQAGQQVYSIEVSEDDVSSEDFMFKLHTNFRVDLQEPVTAKLKKLKATSSK